MHMSICIRDQLYITLYNKVNILLLRYHVYDKFHELIDLAHSCSELLFE